MELKLKLIPLPSSLGNNGPVNKGVIFIHGLAGDYKTWIEFSNQLKQDEPWPDSYILKYIRYNLRLNSRILNLPFLGTIIRAIAGGPQIEDLALRLKEFIEIECQNYDYLVIVAHSMGGLVARQYILDAEMSILDVRKLKVKALITYATPHKGAILATLARAVAWLLRFRGTRYIQIAQMCAFDSEFLSNLNRKWTQRSINKYFDFYRVVGKCDWIVHRKSAAFQSKVDDKVIMVNWKGHFNIIKPKNNADEAYLVTFNYLRNFHPEFEEYPNDSEE